MAKKDKKIKAAEKKVRVAQKQDKKEKQKEKKSKSKGKGDNDDSDGEEADLDAILAEYAKKQEEYQKVTEITVEPPPPRSSATIIASPDNDREIFLFGGEHYNGATASFSNDLFVYRINNDEWRRVTSPNSPLPRSGHAMCRGGNTGGLYLFGGEFSSPKQGTFYHYNDFWRLEPASREWTKLESKGSAPSARSGHRMVYFRRYIVLFGGFQDTSQQTKYLNDLFIYDCQTFTWHAPALPPAAGKPDARSSFSLLPHETGAVLYGGYSRVKTTAAAGRATKGGRQVASRVIMKPVVHQDTWFLRITPPATDAPANALPTVRWERRKRPANTPSPPRAGATMVHHKGRGIAFGGVHDVEEDEEGMESEFFNQLWAYNIDRNRFFQLALRKPRGPPKKQQAGAERGKRGRGRADEEELLRNLAVLEGKGSLADAEDGDVVLKRDGDDDDATSRVEKPVLWEMPHVRFNTQLAVQDDVLYVYGGTFEKGDREFTFDELHAIDLGKLDGARELFRRELEDWQGSEDEDSDEDDEDEDDDDGSDEGQSLTTPATTTAAEEDKAAINTADKPAVEVEEEEAEVTDTLPHPRPFESLRDFFTRTSNQWQDVILEEMKYKRDVEKSVKEIRKTAFERSEQKWWDCREEIQALEDAQEEAGIGEVVSITDRGGADGGPRRR